MVRVTRIIIDAESKEVKIIEYVIEGDEKIEQVFVKKEVVLSPKLLMLSGIGPADELRQANISSIKYLAVGKNLHDHINVIAFKFKLNGNSSSMGNLEDAQNSLVYWLSTHEGVMSNIEMFDTITYFQTPFETQPGVPDIQISLGGICNKKPYMPLGYYDQGIMTVTQLNPKSRGELKLNKTDPINSPPLIYANYFTHPDDIKSTIAGLRMARKVFGTKAFVEKDFRDERVDDCTHHEFDSEKYWVCVLQRRSSTSSHLVGTCKMGPKNDINDVVDSTLKVYGVKNLRVVDASVMPVIIRGNTNVPTIMIAEKASDMIKSEWL